MKKWLLLSFALLGITGSALAREAGDVFTIILVRHAEKSTTAEVPADPPLSRCGEQRAASLAKMLQSVSLDHVYSTPYERTRSTARPVAESKGLGIKIYDPSQLDAFAGQLLEQEESALVVGHSNTTSILAGLLSGEAGEEFDEDEYDRLYLVARFGNHSQVILLDQAFHCDR